MDQNLLQQIRDAILGVTAEIPGSLNSNVYLQQIRDAVLGVSGGKHDSNLNEAIYLQQIRNAILGVPDGQFGSLASQVYLQEIRNAFQDIAGNTQGSMDEDLYLEEILALGPDVLGGESLEYYQRVMATNPITYWPLWEASGNTADDLMDLGDASYNNVTLGQTGIGDGKTGVGCSASYINIYSAALNAAFDHDELTMMIWLDSAASAWSDGALHYLMQLLTDVNNMVFFYQASPPGQLQFMYTAGGVSKFVNYLTTNTDFFCAVITVSKAADEMRAFFNGEQVGVTQTGLGNWVGNLDPIFCAIASNAGVIALSPIVGTMAHAAIWDRALTPAEVASLSSPFDVSAMQNFMDTINIDNASASLAADPAITPTYDESGQVIHPSVIDFGAGGWNGHRYWMAVSGFTNGDDQTENTHILVSADGQTWSVPDGLTNPLAGPPEAPDYYSDPNLSYYDGTLYVVDRFTTAGNATIRVQSSTDGVNWSVVTNLFTVADSDCLSPSVVHDGTQFRMYYRNSTTGAVEYRTCDTMTGSWSSGTQLPTATIPGDVLWHLEVRKTDGGYVMIATDGADVIWLLRSWSGIVWQPATQALLTRAGADWDQTQLYKASIIRTPTGFSVWYSGKSGLEWHIGETALNI